MSSLIDDIIGSGGDKRLDFYDILGCSEHSTDEQITTEYKARAILLHPDKCPGDPDATDKFAALQQAKEILLDKESRQKYDKWRHSGISMSFEQWSGLKGAAHTSMHWACKKPQPMIGGDDQTMMQSQPNRSTNQCHSELPDLIPGAQTSSGVSSTNTFRAEHEWDHPPSDLLKKFRNYEI